MKISEFVDEVKMGVVGLFSIAVMGVAYNLVFNGGLLTTVWMSPPDAATYRIVGEDNRILTINLLPDNYITFSYEDFARDYHELSVVEANGIYGNRYFWRFWRVFEPHTLPIRYVPEGVSPVSFELMVIENSASDQTNPRFLPIGETAQITMYIGDDRLKFSGMWLDRVK